MSARVFTHVMLAPRRARVHEMRCVDIMRYSAALCCRVISDVTRAALEVHDAC